MTEIMNNATARGAMIGKIESTMDNYKKLQNLWDNTDFIGRVDLFFEEEDNKFFILWATDNDDDFETMRELHEGL